MIRRVIATSVHYPCEIRMRKTSNPRYVETLQKYMQGPERYRKGQDLVVTSVGRPCCRLHAETDL